MTTKIRWTPQEDEQLIEQYTNSVSTITIENRSTGSIRSRISTLIKNGKLEKITKKGSKSWTTEEEQLLSELREQGFTAKEIAEKLGRTKSSIDGKARNKRSDTISNWSVKELEFLHSNIHNMTYLEIATILNRGLESVKYASLKLGYSKSNIIQASDDELLDLVRKYKSLSAMDRNKTQGEPGSHIIIHRFGSWSKACDLAGIGAVTSNLVRDRPTIVYLVDFQEFKKVGITQQTIKERFYGYPAYTILDYKIFSNPVDACTYERLLLDKLSGFSFEPKFFPGKTECFKADFITMDEIIDISPAFG